MKYPYTVELAYFESEDGMVRLLIEKKDAKFTKWARVTNWEEVTFTKVAGDIEIANRLESIVKEETIIQEDINKQIAKLTKLRDRKNALLPTVVDNFVDIEPETCSNGGVELGQPPQSK